MMPRVSVVFASPITPDLRDIESVDRQSADRSAFELIAVDDLTDAERTRMLHQLSQNRTNVQVLESTPGAGPGERLTHALEASSGDYVLVLEPGWELAPDALTRLVVHADETGAELCIARAGRLPGEPLPTGTVLNDVARLDRATARRAPSGARLYLRSFLLRAGFAVDADLGSVALMERATEATDRVAALGSYPALLPTRQWASSPQVGKVVTARLARVENDGHLTLVIRVRPEPGAPGLRIEGARMLISLFHETTNAELFVSEEDMTTAGHPGGGLVVRAKLRTDVRLGETAIDPGVWRPFLTVADPPSSESVPICRGNRLPNSQRAAGRTHVFFAENEEVRIDVDATRRRVPARFDLDNSTVSETSRGNLLIAAVKGLRLVGDDVLRGELRIGHLLVPATLRLSDDGVPTLRAWVSGIAGSYRLATRFSAAGFASAHACLRIDPAGTMAVVPLPPDDGAPAAGKD